MLNPVRHRMLYSCTHTAAVDVKGLELLPLRELWLMTSRITYFSAASACCDFSAPRSSWLCCDACLQPELLDSTESLWLLPESLPGPPWCPAAAAPPLLPAKLRRTRVGELSLDVVSGALLSTLAIPSITHTQQLNSHVMVSTFLNKQILFPSVF